MSETQTKIKLIGGPWDGEYVEDSIDLYELWAIDPAYEDKGFWFSYRQNPLSRLTIPYVKTKMYCLSGCCFNPTWIYKPMACNLKKLQEQDDF